MFVKGPWISLFPELLFFFSPIWQFYKAYTGL